MRPTKLSVAHFNSELVGGAAIAARRLHDSLPSVGVQSKFYYLQGERPDETYESIWPENGLPEMAWYYFRQGLYRWRLHRAVSNSPAGYERPSPSRTPYKKIVRKIGTPFSIAHMHWISHFVDYPSFFSQLDAAIPIVWTLHDMYPFTGGCHYAWDCEKYIDKCSCCPQLENKRGADFAAKHFEIKLASLARRNLHVVADSYWLEARAKESRVLANARSFQTIHYGLDTDLFAPKAKDACRTALGIPKAAAAIAFGADSVSIKRKGTDLLLQALQRLAPEQQVVLLIFGRSFNFPAIKHPNISIVPVGYVESPNLLSAVYSAADIFVIPSLQEAFGQTALEAMACGTPVVGFRTGGIPDTVIPGVTGELAKPGDVNDLAAKISALLGDPELRGRMAINCRKTAVEKFALEVQAKHYLELYESLMK